MSSPSPSWGGWPSRRRGRVGSEGAECDVKTHPTVAPLRCAVLLGSHASFRRPHEGEGERHSRIERGDESPVEPVLASPRQVRVGTWPLRFRTLAWAPARRTPKTVSCILAAPVRCRCAEDFRPRRRSSIPTWFLSAPRRNAKGLRPGPCPGFPRPPKWPGTLGQRAGPTR